MEMAIKIEQKRVAKAGYEKYYEMALEQQEGLLEKIKARVEEEFKTDNEVLNNIINESSRLIDVEVEVPDEIPAEENCEITETQEY